MDSNAAMPEPTRRDPFANRPADVVKTDPRRADRAGMSPSPQWLVSVRNLSEARLALDFPIDVLDLKEPSQGPLAPVAAEVWNEVAVWMGATRAEQMAGLGSHRHAGARPKADDSASSGIAQPDTSRVALSAALGESHQALTCVDRLPAGFTFAKVGPAGCSTQAALAELWQGIRALLPKSVELVAVAYADHVSAGTLPAKSVFALAGELGFARVLVDTYDKSCGAIEDHLDESEIQSLIALARRLEMWTALAGSIRLSRVRHWMGQTRDPDGRSQPRDSHSGADLLPDCFGVRGDVCQDNTTPGESRKGELCPRRLSAWSEVLESQKTKQESLRR